jgi:hypothetical protein
MLQSIEAEVSPDGRVTLLEPVRLAARARAVVTILPETSAPTGTLGAAAGRGMDLLAVLDSPGFTGAKPGDPAQMERTIDANRAAWGD